MISNICEITNYPCKTVKSICDIARFIVHLSIKRLTVAALFAVGASEAGRGLGTVGRGVERGSVSGEVLLEGGFSFSLVTRAGSGDVRVALSSQAGGGLLLLAALREGWEPTSGSGSWVRAWVRNPVSLSGVVAGS